MGIFCFEGDFLYFDIHSHILPDVDDGAKNTEDAVALLKMMKKSGISTVLATPHFYPMETNFEEFLEITRKAYDGLLKEIKGKKLPQVYLGCEMLYYKGIGNSEVLGQLCLNRSKYLLLELANGDITPALFEDITGLKEKGIIPIIAHIERYAFDRNFKKLLSFLKENDIPIQINAVSFLIPPLKRVIKMLFKAELFCVVATDTHSVYDRPPFMKEALSAVRDTFGKGYRIRLTKNATRLYDEIVGNDNDK